MVHILVVEDEIDLANLLKFNLEAEGYRVSTAHTGASALATARQQLPELAILDMMLPDISGTDVARALWSLPQPQKLPIILLTARTEEQDRIRGLELGVDDYVVKPFSVKELLLRIRNVLRRRDSGQPSSAPIQVGNLVIDEERHVVSLAGESLSLTALEFRLLKTLIERPSRVQTREALLADVWGIQADIETRTVDTHIKRLREKLGTFGDHIETVRGVGYKFEP